MSDQLLKIAEDVGEIKGDVKGINRRLDTLNGSVLKNSTRINGLEDFRLKMMTIFSVIALIASFLGSVLKDFILRFLGV